MIQSDPNLQNHLDSVTEPTHPSSTHSKIQRNQLWGDLTSAAATRLPGASRLSDSDLPPQARGTHPTAAPHTTRYSRRSPQVRSSDPGARVSWVLAVSRSPFPARFSSLLSSQWVKTASAWLIYLALYWFVSLFSSLLWSFPTNRLALSNCENGFVFDVNSQSGHLQTYSFNSLHSS
jgi:hypothetical protein